MHDHGILLPGNVINRSHPLNRGLVSEWAVLPNRIGAGGSLTLRGLLGRYHGTLTGGITWNGLSRPNGYGSLKLNGSDGYLSYGTSFPSLPGHCTFSFWFNRAVTGSHHIILADNDINGQVIIRISASDAIDWFHGGSNVTFSAGFTVGTGLAHYTLTRSGSAGSWQIGCYINGRPTADTGQTITANPAASPADYRIGSATAYGQYTQGNLDGIQVWNRVLSDAQIQQNLIESRQGNPNRWNWIRRPYYVEQPGGGGGGSSIVRQMLQQGLFCGVAS